MKKRVVIIGAGPAGLCAAYELLDANPNIELIIIESENKVGGLAKTIYDENGNGTDIGPHRFHSKNEDVLNFWDKFLLPQNAPAIDDIMLNRKIEFNSLGADPEKADKVFLKRKRFSRIFYKNCFIDYPIKLKPSTILAMGIPTTIIAGFSYLKSCIKKLPETNLETFMINRFGKVLYELFFEGYTQKVWGVHPSKISKDWGSQRIKGISLINILKNAILSPLKLVKNKEVSLIDEYSYPKWGASQLWEIISDEIKIRGGKILLNTEVKELVKADNKICAVKVFNKDKNTFEEILGDIFISSMPIKELLCNMNEVPENIKDIASKLVYRDFILVNYIVSKFNLKNNTKSPTINDIAPDSWIYLQDNGIHAGRLDIMNNFSPYLVKNLKEDIVINLEYFCNENDDFWNKDDSEIINFGVSELDKLKAVKKEDIKSSKVIRVKKAYPSYFGSYDKFDLLKDYINSIDNLYCIGRNGSHKYNNMDHSVLSGIVVSRVLNQSLNKNLLWDINTDSEYQETKKI